MIPFQHGVFATASAAAGGFESIATVTATGGETSLTFSSIPQGYASLQIRGIAALSTSGNVTGIRLEIKCNADASSANYTYHELFGNGSVVTAAGGGGGSWDMLLPGYIRSGGWWTNIRSAYLVDIHDYASTTRYKTMRALSGVDLNAVTTQANVDLASGLWMSTTAITSLSVLPSSDYFVAGSTFALYGIKGAA